MALLKFFILGMLKHSDAPLAGKYLAAPLKSSKKGVVGKVLTPKFSLEEFHRQCLSFWYIHNGHSSKDSLTVYLMHGLDIFPSTVWRETSEY